MSTELTERSERKFMCELALCHSLNGTGLRESGEANLSLMEYH